jgi:hypothetical protein
MTTGTSSLGAPPRKLAANTSHDAKQSLAIRCGLLCDGCGRSLCRLWRRNYGRGFAAAAPVPVT